VAERLRTSIREIDTIARLGGDEFAIIQADLQDSSGAAMFAQRLQDAIRAPCMLNGRELAVDASVGIALAPDDGTDADELLKRADMALYAAKADGRSRFRFFAPEMDARMHRWHEMIADLRSAIATGGFELHYQPVLDLGRNKISGVEALLRWRHPQRGMVSPAEFIPIAEQSGLIVPIGEWALRRACADAAQWPADIRIAVNLSPVQVTGRNLVQTVIGALAASGLPASRLELEITETVLMQNTSETLATLHQLRALGVRIALDDFGVGYSSLSYLRSFPFDKIKIDRSFVSDVSESEEASAIVQAVVQLARSLGIATTAEGVETERQMARVRDLGCTEIQGFLFSAPLAAAETSKLLQARSERTRASAA
jgi:predicted signal transduction protein with EAL and GGDEF domain